jgi:hypothetical protein
MNNRFPTYPQCLSSDLIGIQIMHLPGAESPSEFIVNGHRNESALGYSRQPDTAFLGLLQYETDRLRLSGVKCAALNAFRFVISTSTISVCLWSPSNSIFRRASSAFLGRHRKITQSQVAI